MGWVMILGGTVAILLQPAMESNLLWRPVAWGIPALLLVAGGLALECRGRLPRAPGLETLGAASYALYLTHELTIGVIRNLFTALPGPVALPCVLVVCIAMALLVHWYVEQPMGRWLSSKMAPRRAAEQHAGG